VRCLTALLAAALACSCGCRGETMRARMAQNLSLDIAPVDGPLYEPVLRQAGLGFASFAHSGWHLFGL